MLGATFSGKEAAFLGKHELCRLATVSADGRPHVVPVNYVFREGRFYVAVDYATRKLKNIRSHNRVALVVDSFRPQGAVMVEGPARIIEKGAEFRSLYALFHEKFAWVRSDPWTEGQAPFIEVNPDNKVSWGL